mmetsp:Transcript_26539/g.42507  ORF Transcript_26539/g.42507 Transcript_26539/m.42507 type:complete len:200 (+) Transcript_26539:455-1054(+)
MTQPQGSNFIDRLGRLKKECHCQFHSPANNEGQPGIRLLEVIFRNWLVFEQLGKCIDAYRLLVLVAQPRHKPGDRLFVLLRQSKCWLQLLFDAPPEFNPCALVQATPPLGQQRSQCGQHTRLELLELDRPFRFPRNLQCQDITSPFKAALLPTGHSSHQLLEGLHHNWDPCHVGPNDPGVHGGKLLKALRYVHERRCGR